MLPIDDFRVGVLVSQMLSAKILPMVIQYVILPALIDHTFHWISTQELLKYMDTQSLTSVVEDDVIHRPSVIMEFMDVRQTMTAKMV